MLNLKVALLALVSLILLSKTAYTQSNDKSDFEFYRTNIYRAMTENKATFEVQLYNQSLFTTCRRGYLTAEELVDKLQEDKSGIEEFKSCWVCYSNRLRFFNHIKDRLPINLEISVQEQAWHYQMLLTNYLNKITENNPQAIDLMLLALDTYQAIEEVRCQVPPCRKSIYLKATTAHKKFINAYKQKFTGEKQAKFNKIFAEIAKNIQTDMDYLEKYHTEHITKQQKVISDTFSINIVTCDSAYINSIFAAHRKNNIGKIFQKDVINYSLSLTFEEIYIYNDEQEKIYFWALKSANLNYPKEIVGALAKYTISYEEKLDNPIYNDPIYADNITVLIPNLVIDWSKELQKIKSSITKAILNDISFSIFRDKATGKIKEVANNKEHSPNPISLPIWLNKANISPDIKGENAIHDAYLNNSDAHILIDTDYNLQQCILRINNKVLSELNKK